MNKFNFTLEEFHDADLERNQAAEEKGREPNAPLLRHREAPVPRMHQAAPEWARAGTVLGQKVRGF